MHQNPDERFPGEGCEMTPRNFNAAELDEMQVDWQRTHNVKMVA